MNQPRQITELLKDCGNGNEDAWNRLLPQVYEELHRQAAAFMRKERSGHTLQPTALINEAYFKLIGHTRVEWQNRSHFFAVASTAMRRILVDYARERQREKRGGVNENLPLEDAIGIASGSRGIDLVALDEALDRLAKFDQRQARVVELKYFSGLTNDETAEVLGISNATVRLDWNLAKAWLKQQLES